MQSKSKTEILYTGWTEPTNFHVKPVKAPAWVDRQLLAHGQKFAQEHLFAISFGDLLSLLFLFSYDEGLQPLIFTGQSGCVFSSYSRYLSTQRRVNSWYKYDILDPRSKAGVNLAAVRHMHKHVTKTMDTATSTELKARTTITRPMTSILKPLREDLEEAGVGDCDEIIKDFRDVVYLNQWQMAFTQFGFIGLAVLHPEKLGLVGATDEDLEGLVHTWAVIGHQLGLKDENNWCLEGLDAVRERGAMLIDSFILPKLKNADSNWEHMSRAMARGVEMYMPSVSFEKLLLYLFWVLKVPTPRLWKNTSWTHRFWFYFTRFNLTVMIYLPGMKSFFNWLYKTGTGVAEKGAPEWMEQVKEKATMYENKFHSS